MPHQPFENGRLWSGSKAQEDGHRVPLEGRPGCGGGEALGAQKVGGVCRVKG